MIYDSLTKKGLQANVDVIDLASNRVISQVSADATGKYLATLPMGRNYAFNVNQKGYLFYSSHFEMPALAKQAHFQVDIPLQPIVAGANIILKNVFFNTGKWDLLTESLSELDRLVVLLNDNPSIRIEISGHTDNVGKDADNKILSESRAKSVVAYLKAKGILETRLAYKGYGASHPVAANDTEEGRAMNRRTEMVVISK
jgi:outer membrane protein OmpA-like peptidoglycan-associated protein